MIEAVIPTWLYVLLVLSTVVGFLALLFVLFDLIRRLLDENRETKDEQWDKEHPDDCHQP